MFRCKHYLDNQVGLIQPVGVMPVNWKLLQLFTARTDNGHAVAINNISGLGFLIFDLLRCRHPFGWFQCILIELCQSTLVVLW